MATIDFSVNRALIQAGECATLHWRVSGVKEVYVFAEGEHWQEHGVVGEGHREVCPPQTTVYNIRVIHQDGSKEVRQLVVQVQPAAGSSAIQQFTVDRVEVHSGECVNFRWRVEGVKAVYFHPEGARWQDYGVEGVKQQQVCPSESTTYHLRVIKRDDSVEIRRMPIYVQGAGAPSVIQQFSVDRVEIRSGECVNFRWHVEGVKAVYFHPEGARWQDYGVEGVKQQQVCPSESTTYHLRVIKRDDSVETRYIPIYIQR